LSGTYTLNGGAAATTNQACTSAAEDVSAILVSSSGDLTLHNPTIRTSGNSSSTENSSCYGLNAAVLATKSSRIAIFGGTVTTSGSGANGLFATGAGASVSMTGGSITLSNVNVTSYGASSSAIATDYGGGTVNVTGGTIYASNTTAGSHSAAIYSTGVITVNSAKATSMADCGGVIDGANSIILTNTDLTGLVEGIKVHRTAPASGNATIKINGGSLTATAGDGFYVTGTSGNAAFATINVSGGATITASTGNILNVDSSSAATLTASGVTLIGNFIADSSSTITNTLQNGTKLTGCINTAKLLTIDSTSTWNATSNSVVTSLTNSGTINLTGKITTTNVWLKSGGTFGGTGTLSSNLTVNSGATLVLNPATNFVVGGNVIFGGAVTVVPSTTNISTGSYKLLTYSNSLSGTPIFTYSAPSGSGQTAVFNTATSGVIYVTISAAPSTPTNLSAAAGDARVTLRWNSADNAASYNIRRSPASGSDYAMVGNSSTTNFVDVSLTNGMTYYYVVTSTNSSGESAYSSEVGARPVSSTATTISLGVSDSQFRVNRPSDHTGWRLQVQTNSIDSGLSTNWVTVPDSSSTNHVSIPIDPANGCVFFRLISP
jgi:hypothetical protein